MDKSTVYIDESGDLGRGKGTQWLVITAVIVDKDKENEIRQIISAIKSRLNVNEVHLRKITDCYKRSYIVKELNEGHFTYINIIADTNNIMLSSDIAYNYMCRMLIERVSWFLRDTGRIADIVLSARGTSKDGDLIEYLIDKLILSGNNQIAQGVFDRVMAKTANSWDMLQLVDVCATTTFLAHEINGWGFRTPCYFKVLENHLYRHRGNAMKYGIKYFTDEMIPTQGEMECEYPCKEKERTSGVTSTD